MATIPFVPATCILLPTAGSDNLLQQLSSLLVKPTTSADNVQVASTINNSIAATVGQGNVLRILTSDIPQSADSENTSTETVIGTSNSATTPVFVSPYLITTTTGTNNTTPALQVELINALLRLQGTAVATSSTTTEPDPQVVPLMSTSSETHSVSTPDHPGEVSTGSTTSASPGNVLVNCKHENNDDDSSGRLREIASYPRHLSREANDHRKSLDNICPSNLLLHQLLTGEDASRVRSRSELILADTARDGTNCTVDESSVGPVDEAIIKPEDWSRVTSVELPAPATSLHQKTTLSLPMTVEPTTTSTRTTESVASNAPTISLTMEQFLEILREHTQTLRDENDKGQSSNKITLNLALLKQLMPHLMDHENPPRKKDTGQQLVDCECSVATLPNQTNTIITAGTVPTSLSVTKASLSTSTPNTLSSSASNSLSLPKTEDCNCLPEKLPPDGHRDSQNPQKLEESVSTRPRCHSDHQLNRRPLFHNNCDQTRYLYQQHTSFSQQRPRSFSKVERRCYNRSIRSGLCDNRLTATDCDPNHSLIAKLVLTPEENWDSITTLSNASPATPTPSLTTTAETLYKSEYCASSSPSPSSASSATTFVPTRLTEDVGGCRQPPLTCYTCSAADCRQALYWLQESDAFVTRYCLGIPSGSLMITVRSFNDHVPHGCQTQTKETTDILNKIWPQLLLIYMVEKRFIFSINAIIRICDEQKPPVSCKLPISIGTEAVRTISYSNGAPINIQKVEVMSSSRRTNFPSPTSLVPSLPAIDDIFVDQLRRLIAAGACMGLTSEVYHLMRLTVLAQSAYPKYFTRPYADQLSDLETELTTGAVLTTTDEKNTVASRLVGTLRLLNQLHSINPMCLLSLFKLASVTMDVHPTVVDCRAEIQPGPETETKQPPSQVVLKTDVSLKHNHGSGDDAASSSTSTVAALVGASKRKATTVNRRRYGSTAEEVPHQQTVITPNLEPVLRCRANTVAGANTTGGSGFFKQCKTARLS